MENETEIKIDLRFFTRKNWQGCTETLCYLNIDGIKQNEFTFNGLALQSPKDEYNQEKGEKLALTRALYWVKYKYVRTAVWKQYFDGKPIVANFEVVNDG